MDDKEIIRRVKGGDIESFSLLVERYHEKLLGFIHKLVRDGPLAEDIGQEVFLNVYKALPYFDENRGVPFSAWLFIAARNRTITELRKKMRRREQSLEDAMEVADDTRHAMEGLMESEMQVHLTEALAQVPEPFQSALRCQLEGKSIKEIAQSQGVIAATVKSRLFRAKSALSSIMKGKRS